jgi:hypothetical protein
MADVTNANRATVDTVISNAVVLQHEVGELIARLLQVKNQIASANTAPGAGNNADWVAIVEWYLPLYQVHIGLIQQALVPLGGYP